MIYFDNSATSFYKPEIVKQRVMVALEKFTANAGRSGHKPSQDVAEIVYDTREMVKNFFGAKNYEVIFTKNCSEALNLAILGTLKSGDHVITTMFEHNSVLRPLEYLKSKGVEVSYLDCELKDLDTKIVSHIKSNTKMLITTAMSNVTGDITNIERLGLICEKYNIIYLVDGAQASGHIDINLTDSYVDMFTFSGHKGLLSLTGVGALVVKKGTILSNILFGGTGTESEKLIQPQEFPEGYEVGTLPIIPIVSLNAGMSYIMSNKTLIYDKENKLGNYFYKNLIDLPFVDCYFSDGDRNVFSFNIKNMDCSYVANKLDEDYSICVRSGLHCAPLTHKFLGTFSKGGTVRVSIDFFNSKAEIDRFVQALIEIKHY